MNKSRLTFPVTAFIFVLLALLPISKSYASFDSPDFVTSQSDSSVKFQEKVGDHVMHFLHLGSVALIAYNNDIDGLKQYAITTGLTSLTTLMLKFSVARYRPNGSNQDSFPSGHSSLSFSGASFIYDRYGPELGIPAYALASYVAYSRVAAKRHHISDVIAGAAISIGMTKLFVKPFEFKIANTKVALNAMPSYSEDGVSLNLFARF